MSKENDSINDRLDNIAEAIVVLSEKFSSLERRLINEDGLKKSSSIPIDIPPKPRYESPKSALHEHIKPEILDETSEAVPQEAIKNETHFISGSGEKFYIEKEEMAKEEKPAEGLETEIGLKWLGRIGILALVIGIAFFMRYAFENNWITETGRVVMGIFAGMTLIYLGDYLRQKYTSYASTLTGGGIAVLYLSIYSSFQYYHIFNQEAAFVAMVIITAIGAFFAIRYDQISLAVLSILGGFLTPLLLSTGTNNQIGLFSYMTILNLGILAISFYRNWQKLNLLGFLATLFLYLGWSAQYYDAKDLFITEAFLTLWFIIYSVAVISHNMLSKKKTDATDLTLIILNGLVYFGISYSLLIKDYGDYLGFFTVLMAGVYFVFAYVSYQANSEDKELALFFPGLSIFFLTIAAPIQFDGFWVTIAWAIEAAILVAAGFYLKSFNMRYFAWVLLMIVIIRLIFVDNYGSILKTDYTLIFNERFLAFAVGVISFSAVYCLYSKYENLIKSDEFKSKAVALFMLNFLLLWNLSAEISAYYNNKIRIQNTKIDYPQCDSRLNSAYCDRQMEDYYASRTADSEEVKKIQSAEIAALTVFWSFYAIVLLAFGIKGKNRLLRLMGIGLFGVTIAKAFLYGFMAMQDVWRIVAFMILGVLLLAASFAYNKYKEKIKEII